MAKNTICLYVMSIGSGRGSSLHRHPAGSSTSVADFSVNEDGDLKLDIYASAVADIRACKMELDHRLGKAMETVIWSQKPSYAADRENIAKLSSSQVSLGVIGIRSYIRAYTVACGPSLYTNVCTSTYPHTHLYACMYVPMNVCM